MTEKLQSITKPRLKAGSFLFVLGLIICLGALPRLLSYNFALPYIEYSDEAHLYWTAQSLRGQYDPTYNAGYPPAFIELNAGVQILTEWLGHGGLAAAVQVLRLMGVIANLFTILFVGLSARLLAGDLAGWLAALFWAVAQLPVEYSLYAIPETFTYPLAAWIIYLALRGLYKQGGWYWSLPVAALISLFEYRYVVFLLPAIFVLLANAGQHWRPRKWLRLGIGLVALGALAILALYILVPLRRGWLIQILTVNLWDFSTLSAYLSAAIEPLNPLIVLVIAAFGVWAGRKQRISREQGLGLLLGVLMILAICWISSSVVWSGDQGVRVKQVIPALSIAVILFAALFAYGFRYLGNLRLRWLYGVGICLLLFVPQLAQTTDFVKYSRQESSHVLVRQWADENLTPGTVIVDRFNNTTFNPYWGGIPIKHWFDWWTTDDFMAYSPAEWRERGMTYMLLPLGQRDKMLQTEAGRDYLAQMLLLREFPAVDTRRGPVTAMYRLWRMEVEKQIDFADGISLRGYDLVSVDAHPGGSLALRFYWQAQTTPHDNYSLFVHFTPENSVQPVAQYDGEPAVPTRSTLLWVNPSETLISPVITIDIPEDAAPGTYVVRIGLYNFTTLVRLPIVEGETAIADHVDLMRVDLTP